MSPERATLTPSDRLLQSTRRRLAIFTLVLVAALVTVVGMSTLFVASGLMRDNIDSILRAASVDDRLVHDIADQENEFGVRPLGSSDTFLMLVDATGRLLSGSSTARLDGLPDPEALRAAVASGQEDIREGNYGGVDVRLLTTRAKTVGEDGAPSNRVVYLQAGFVMTLQKGQERQLFLAVLGVALFGLLGAALVTVLVTRRALVPIRSAFATERRFVAAASHELRTPVTVIRSSAEILEREHLVADDGRPLIDDVIAEAERLGTLVGDLITLATAQAGAIALDREAVELRDVVRASRHGARQHLRWRMASTCDIEAPPGGDDIVALRRRQAPRAARPDHRPQREHSTRPRTARSRLASKWIAVRSAPASGCATRVLVSQGKTANVSSSPSRDCGGAPCRCRQRTGAGHRPPAGHRSRCRTTRHGRRAPAQVRPSNYCCLSCPRAPRPRHASPAS